MSRPSPKRSTAHAEVFPDERLDCYLVDGKLYQVDTMFCVQQDCDCTDTRLSVLAFSDDRKEATEVGGAWLPVETMMPLKARQVKLLIGVVLLAIAAKMAWGLV